MGGSRSSRKRQARLTFSPLPTSSPAAKNYNQQIQDRAASVRYEGASPTPMKRRKLDVHDISQAENRNDFMPTPAATMSLRASSTANSSDDDDDVIWMSSDQRGTKKYGFMRSTGTTPRQRGQKKLELSRGDSDGEQIITRPNQGSVNPKQNKSAQDGKSIDFGDKDDDEEEEDDMPTTVGKRRRKKTSLINSSPPVAKASYKSDDDIEVVGIRARKSGRGRLRDQDSDQEVDNMEQESEDDEDIGPITPGRRTLKRPRQFSRQEQNDLEEDLDFIGPSNDVESDTARRPRDTQSRQKNARQRALEDLKRRRSGQAPASALDEHSDDGDDHEEQRTEATDELDDASDHDTDTVPTSSRSMFQADEHDEDFVVNEGEDEILGVPDGVPLQFTRYASMKAKDLFKFAIEWMVQKKINPAFHMHHEIYDLTFKKLDDEIKGLVRSKFSSSAWTLNFNMSLGSRPTIAISELDRAGSEHFMLNHCDACNRSNHPATYEIQFQGNPYHRQTLDDVERVDEDDEDSDEDEESQDEEEDGIKGNQPNFDMDGREVPAANTIYYVGRFCMSNAETAHELQHWRYHLYEWVLEWIDGKGYSAPAKVVERDRWRTKKRRKYANKIVGRMQQEGVVKKLWKEFQDSINRARESKQGRWN